MHSFILTILLLAPNGTRSPILPTEYKTMRECMVDLKSLGNADMGNWEILGARCEVKK